MITNDDLINICKEYFVVNDMQSLSPEYPKGWPPIPIEFELYDHHVFPTQWAYIVEDVELSGTIGVCHYANQVVLDVAYYGRLDLWDRNKPYFDQSVQCRHAYSKMPLTGLWMSMMGCWSNNYFHWTLEMLPMLRAAFEAEKLYGVKPKILITQYPAPFIRPSLEAFGWSGDDVVEVPSYNLSVEQLLIPPVGRLDGYTLPSSVQFLRANDIPTGAMNPRRIYISRSRSNKRNVVNEEELLPVLRKHGFLVVHLEDHPWRDQVSLMQTAKLIVGPHGAGLTNMAYSYNSARIIEIANPAYRNPCFYTLASACGHHYMYLPGQPMPGENIYLESEVLDEAIQEQTRR